MNHHWSQSYSEFTGRNIGILTEENQEKLRSSTIAVFGMGGVGSPAFEVLVRTGVGHFKIVDKDVFDASNMNRQIFAFQDTLDQKKVDVAKAFAKKINPEVSIETYLAVEEENIEKILTGCDIVVLAIDELKPCVITSRQARKMNIPLVEGWAIPFGNVRAITEETDDLETIYGLPTKGRKVSDITEEEFKTYGLDVLLGLGGIEGIADFYTQEAVNRIMQGHITSFAPMAWLTSVLLANEALKMLLGWGTTALGPQFTLYDPFAHKVPEQQTPGA